MIVVKFHGYNIPERHPRSVRQSLIFPATLCKWRENLASAKPPPQDEVKFYHVYYRHFDFFRLLNTS